MERKWILYEDFKSGSLNEALTWSYEPKNWFIDEVASQLVFTTEEDTDYWQKTHYGF